MISAALFPFLRPARGERPSALAVIQTVMPSSKAHVASDSWGTCKLLYNLHRKTFSLPCEQPGLSNL